MAKLEHIGGIRDVLTATRTVVLRPRRLLRELVTAAGVLETSVFIARESGRQPTESLIPEEVVTIVITLTELNAGVLVAPR